MDGSTVLVGFVMVLMLVALVFLGASKPDGERKRREPVGERKKVLAAAAGQSSHSALRGPSRAPDDQLPGVLSVLRVPPPDEARIEAIAPKNDSPRRAK